MPIFEFRCADCRGVFDYFFRGEEALRCMNCDSLKVMRLDYSFFYPNKAFCPHDKKVEVAVVKNSLGEIMLDRSLSCAGCGVDGEAGACNSGGCGGGCGGCGGGFCKV